MENTQNSQNNLPHFQNFPNAPNHQNFPFTVSFNSPHCYNDPFLSPSFSTSAPQCSQMSPEISTPCEVEENGEEGNHQAETREQRKMWSKEEDKLLISSWLNISKDQVVGTDQKATAFWQRVMEYFNEFRGLGPQRSCTQCRCRWQKMNAAVAKFVGCYSQAKQRRKSGESDNDTLMAAHAFYKSDVKKNFLFEHAWNLLRMEPKWKSNIDGGAKKMSMNEFGCNLSSNQDMPTTPTTPSTPMSFYFGEENIVRPPGVKTTKRKSKSSTSKDKEEERDAEKIHMVRNILSLKEKELKAKEEKNRMRKFRMISEFSEKETLTVDQKIMLDKLRKEVLE